MKYKKFFLDLETTGLDKEIHAIHQITFWIEYGNIFEKYSFRVKPFKGALVNAKALDIANVSIDTLRTYTDEKTVFNKIIKILDKHVSKFDKKDKFFTIGYNNNLFDNPFFRKWFERNGNSFFGSYFHSGSIDVMSLAANDLRGQIAELKSFKLADVAEYYEIKVEEEKLHDADYDVYLTYQIFNKINNNE